MRWLRSSSSAPGARQRWLLAVAALLVLGVGADAMTHPSRAALRLERSLPTLPSTRPAADAAAAAPASGASSAFHFPFLADEPTDASLSVGGTSHGLVVNARELVESEACGIVPTHRSRDLHWGTAALVTLLEQTAAELRARTKTRLWVGNLGRRDGGGLSYSVSHHCGRDADIALAYLDQAGRPTDPPDLVPLNAEGVSKDGRLRFDAARNWLVVKALLQSSVAQVQYVFLASPLRRLLVRYASEHGEPGELLERAAAVVQPAGGGGSHNDHMHLRIYCSEQDVEAGCVDTGVLHPWVKRFDASKVRRIALVAARLQAAEADERRRALERLVLLDARAEARSVAGCVADPEPQVRRAAARATGVLGASEQELSLVDRYRVEPDFEVKVELLGALRQLGGPVAAAFLQGLIQRPSDAALGPWTRATALGARASWWLPPAGPAASLLEVLPGALRRLGNGADAGLPWKPGDPPPEREADAERALLAVAMDAAGRSERLEPVDALLSRLQDPDGAVRAAAAVALGYATNRSIGAGWEDPQLGPAVRARYLGAWARWVERLRGKPRDGWLTAGFVAVGYRVPELHQRHLWELVRALGGPPYLAFNARRALERLTEHQPPDRGLEGPEACHYWLRWLRSHRTQFRLEAPPPAVVQTCP